MFKERKVYKNLWVILFLVTFVAVKFSVANAKVDESPKLLSYAELTTLYENEKNSETLEAKLNQLLTNPFVDNSYPKTNKFLDSYELGEHIRVVQGNIERGLNYDAIEAAFTNMSRFTSMVNKEKHPNGSKKRVEAYQDVLMGTISLGRTQGDPTVKHIPNISPNPARKFFSTLEDFRFSDGGAFDFRGDELRTVNGRNKELANSNERAGKGFVTTYQVKRPIKFIGKYKLDWIFIKPANLKNHKNKKGSYKFAPHFGQTLSSLNEVIENRISDHRPMIVDLPLQEPRLGLKP